MLSLSRHAGESIIIGHDVAVFVHECRSDKVRLGIHAPIDVEIHGLSAKVEDPIQLLSLYKAGRTGRPHPALTDGREIGRPDGAR